MMPWNTKVQGLFPVDCLDEATCLGCRNGGKELNHMDVSHDPLLCVWVILFSDPSQRDQGTLNGHPSWGTELLFLKRLLPEKSPLVRECAEGKLLALDRVSPLPWLSWGRPSPGLPSSWIQHRLIHCKKQKKKQEKMIWGFHGYWTVYFLWLLSQILPSKQATDVGNNIWVWWEFILDMPWAKVLTWSPRKWHKLISGQNIKYRQPGSKHWAWSSSSIMFPSCIEFLDFMLFCFVLFCDGCWK